MANPRIDELKRRIEREPGSRLFSQLAEELRKDGDLAEAIRVARSGLAAHPNYPSARLTLGRALFDTGQFGPARIELESVLRGAPDNILAARMLAECLEGLGDAGAALLQYRAAQRLSPDDKQIEAQVRSIEQRLAAGGSARAAAAPAPASGPLPLAGVRSATAAQGMPAVSGLPAIPPPRFPAAATPPGPRTGPPPAPSRLPPGPSSPVVDDFDDVFEPAPAWKRSAAAPAASRDEAILLLEDEAPTLPGPGFGRRAHPGPPSLPEALAAPVTLAFEALPVIPEVAPPVVPEFTRSPDHATDGGPALGADTLAGAPAFFVPPPLPDSAPGAPAPLPASSGPTSPNADARLDPDGSSTAAFAAFPEPTPEPALSLPIPSAPASSPPAPPVPALPVEPSPPHERGVASMDAPEAASGAALSTPTLAELYFDQGFLGRAVAVYEQILEREPHNERVRARLIEVKALARPLDVPLIDDPRVAKRSALSRKIARLEQMLAAVRRG